MSAIQVEHAGPTPTDESLLECWRGGDRRAGDVLVARHVGTVRAYFVHHVNGPDSEDLVQETLSRLTRAILRFEFRSSFRTYLMAIAYKTLQEHLRRSYRRINPESLDDADIGEDALAEHYLCELERHGLAYACVRRLSPECRELVERFYWEGTSARELGREKGIPAGTVRRRLFEARATLRSCYEAARHEQARHGGDVELEQLRVFLSSGATRS